MDDDQELVRRMAGGDGAALRELYGRHGALLLSYLTRRLGDQALAEEVLQDVMLAAWRSSVRFRGECQVRTWLLAIAHNRMLNARRRQRALPASRAAAESMSVPAPTPPDPRLARVRAAVERLPEAQRIALELVFEDGLSMRDAGLVLDVATGTVKSRIHRARLALRELLAEGHDDD